MRFHLDSVMDESSEGVVCHDYGNRREEDLKLLIADMDSTIIEQECLDELATEVGFGDEIKKITKAAMKGEINFETALRDRVSYLKGAPTSTITKVLTNRISIASGARTLLTTMKNAPGASCAKWLEPQRPQTSIFGGTFQHFLVKSVKMLKGDQKDTKNQIR